jgi:hypothetical protein
MNYVYKIASFLHITDSAGQLDIVDLAFIASVIKVVIAPGVDYGAMASLIGIILSKMHADHLEANK